MEGGVETLQPLQPFCLKSGFSSSAVSGAQTRSARCGSSSTAVRCLSSGTSAWYRDPMFIRLGGWGGGTEHGSEWRQVLASDGQNQTSWISVRFGFFQPAKPLLFMSPTLLTPPLLFFSSSTDLKIVPGGLRRLRVLCRVLNSRLVTRLSTALSIMNQMKMIFFIHFFIHIPDQILVWAC